MKQRRNSDLGDDRYAHGGSESVTPSANNTTRVELVKDQWLLTSVAIAEEDGKKERDPFGLRWEACSNFLGFRVLSLPSLVE